MTSQDIVYTHERAAHETAIEKLNAAAFGPARYTRAAYFVRADGPHDLSLSFVALVQESIIGSVRMTPIVIGTAARALLLGPIVVHSDYKGTGVGSKLMNMALEAARKAGQQLVILVGDEPYYKRFGFRRVCPGIIRMPAPLNPDRLLACELAQDALQQAKGPVRHVNLMRPCAQGV